MTVITVTKVEGIAGPLHYICTNWLRLIEMFTVNHSWGVRCVLHPSYQKYIHGKLFSGHTLSAVLLPVNQSKHSCSEYNWLTRSSSPHFLVCAAANVLFWFYTLLSLLSCASVCVCICVPSLPTIWIGFPCDLEKHTLSTRPGQRLYWIMDWIQGQ